MVLIVVTLEESQLVLAVPTRTLRLLFSSAAPYAPGLVLYNPDKKLDNDDPEHMKVRRRD